MTAPPQTQLYIATSDGVETARSQKQFRSRKILIAKRSNPGDLDSHQDRPAPIAVDLGIAAAPELAIVIPTFNERPNIVPLLEKLKSVLDGIDWEVVFVDDNSPDGTSRIAREAASHDRRIRVTQRIGRRGLAGACVEGILSTTAPLVAVMDADLQHDEARLPEMFEILQRNQADLVVGSRYVDAGEIGQGLSSFRHLGSRLATSIARHLFDVELKDPMSGFFMVRREIVEDVAPRLSQQGFKILLDIVLSSKAALRIKEIPFVFRHRQAGDSKLDSAVTFEYLGLLVAKLSYDLVSIRFLLFALVGLVGLIVHLSALRLGLGAGMSFPVAQALAMSTAMSSNFLLNNVMTYRDRRRRGWRLLTGLISFAGVCSVGVVAGVGISSLLYRHDPSWWVAGLAGAVIVAGWNYISSGLVVWRGR